jgi:methylmalonyl-CoA/ethylmalonyl-CoA epimerase
MLKLEHLGFAVKNLSEADELYGRLLGTEPYKKETVPSERVVTSFFKVGEVKIELLAATSNESPIAGFIEKRGEGMHHVAFEVQDIKFEIRRLKSEGFQIINEVPKKGADNKLVAFVHPKSTSGVLVELCQEIS